MVAASSPPGQSPRTTLSDLSWNEVRADEPCPICGHTTWCSLSDDGGYAVCRRESGCATYGNGIQRTDRSGGQYWLYSLRPREQRSEPWDEPRYTLADGRGERADPDTLHRVYSCLLEHLSLASSEEQELVRRGLTTRQQRDPYRTLGSRRASAAYACVRAGLEEHLPRVPGFYIKEDGKGRKYWSLTGRGGLLIPVRDAQARIVALLLRPTPGPGARPRAKYLYLSSRKKGGASPGSPIHVPLFAGEKSTIRITEGTLKAEVATALSGILTVGLPGVGAWRRVPALLRDIGGVQTVRVALDADARRNAHVAAALHGLVMLLREHGYAVELEQWDEAAGKGIDDLLAAGQTPQVLAGDEAVAEAARILAAAGSAGGAPGGPGGEPPDTPGDARPRIVISTDEHLVADAAIAALATDPGVYQRGGQLVRVVRDTSPATRGIRRPSAPRIEALSAAAVRDRMAATAQWRKVGSDDEEAPAHVPPWVVLAVRDRGEWPGIRHLEGVVEYPVLRPDGTLLATPGYDPETGLLYEPVGEPPQVPEQPTRDDAAAACATLLDVIGDFPCAGPAHRAAWLAGVLTPLARYAYAGPAPLYLADANVRGAGKGLLVECISRIVTGEPMAVCQYSSDDDELAKRITSLALAGDRLVIFDNLEGKFGGASLDMALTATHWQGRVLGESRMVRVPLCMTWYATGNNVSVGADTARRICHIRLESPHERPEDRTDVRRPRLLEWVSSERPRLLAAALTILRAYCVAGRPDQGLRPWGSYEAWSALIRGAIVWCGLPDPGETRQVLREQADAVAQGMGTLLVCWQQMDPDRHGLTASDVIARLYPRAGRDGPYDEPPWYSDMRAAVEGLGVRAGDSRALGYRLRSYQRRIFGGLYLGRAGTAHQAARWAVYPASEFARSRPAGEDGEDGGHRCESGGPTEDDCEVI